MQAKRKSNVPLYIILVLLVLLIGALVYMLVAQIRGRATDEEPVYGFSRETHTVEMVIVGEAPGAIGIFEEVDNQIVTRYISVGLELGIFREIDMNWAEYNALVSWIRDTETIIWVTVREIMQEIGAGGLYGLAGQELLGARLLTRLSEIYDTQRIAEVVFTEFAMS